MKLPQIIHKLGSPPNYYRISGYLVPVLLSVGMALLLWAWIWGLAYAPIDAKQGNSFRIIYLHVPSAFIALAGYYVMAFCGLVLLVWQIKLMALMMRSAAVLGACMTFIALFTGAVWGKPTWGTWWVWDARVTSMLILFFLYIGVIALMDAFNNAGASDETGSKAASILALVGTVNIPIIYKSVDWWFSLHQPASIKLTSAPSIHPSMATPLFIAIAGIYLFYFGFLFWHTRVALMHRDIDKKWLKQAEAL